MNAAYGWRLVDDAPDARPAVRLRKELERDRRLGLAFDAIFVEEVDYVIGKYGLDAEDAAAWRAAFLATERAWRSAYDGTTASVSSLRADLLLDAA